MNRKNHRALSCALGALSCLAVAGLPAAAAANPTGCYRVKLKEKPAWVSSATFLADRNQLLLVDPFQNRFLTYSPDGEVMARPQIALQNGSPFYPTTVNLVPGGDFLLELSDGEMVHLDRDFRVHPGPTVVKERTTSDLRVGSLYSWKVVGEAGESIVAYGALLRGTGDSLKVELAFFRLPAKNGRAARPEILRTSEDGSYFLLGNSYIASAGGTAYYVTMDSDRPAIYRVGVKGAAEKLAAAFPAEFQSRPAFQTKMTGPKSAAAHFAELASFAVPAGLYAQDGMLYLLARKPAEAGQTTWLLYKIDPAGKGKVLGVTELPTSALHLTVVPAADSWYLLERGPVLAQQRQDIASMVVVKSEDIAALAKFPSSCAPQ